MSTWILLRGLMREARHWGDFPHMLASGLGGARVLTLDLPGNGSRHQERSPTTIAEMTEHCRQQCQELRIAPPYYLLTLSLGGMVASDWATRYPIEIAGAVLINTSLRPFSPFYHRLRPHHYCSLLGLLSRPTNIVERERTILRLTSNSTESSALLRTWEQYARQYPVSVPNALRQLLAALRYRAPQQPPSAALLILSGGYDQLVDPRCSLALQQHWPAALRIEPDAGHDLTLDAPDWVVKQVCQWMTSDGNKIIPFTSK